MYDKNKNQSVWQLNQIEELVLGRDGVVRGARIKIFSKGGKKVQNSRPLLKLFPLEVEERRKKTMTPCTLADQDDEEKEETRPAKDRWASLQKWHNQAKTGYAVKWWEWFLFYLSEITI